MELHRVLNSHEELLIPEVRVGKWTVEEEKYTVALIRHFLTGTVTASPGISLRKFLAKKLRCSPMRISTKLASETLGGERIPKHLGQRRFFPMRTVTLAQRQRVATELRDLEVAFLNEERMSVGLAKDETASLTSRGGEGINGSGDCNEAAYRVGSWSHEEQVYAAALIDAFLRGVLDQPRDTTLRAFLADQLCCSPMRISKKLGSGVIANIHLPKRLGSTPFQPALDVNVHDVVKTKVELARLRRACFSSAMGQGLTAHKHMPSAPLVRNRRWYEISPPHDCLDVADDDGYERRRDDETTRERIGGTSSWV